MKCSWLTPYPAIARSYAVSEVELFSADRSIATTTHFVGCPNLDRPNPRGHTGQSVEPDRHIHFLRRTGRHLRELDPLPQRVTHRR